MTAVLAGDPALCRHDEEELGEAGGVRAPVAAGLAAKAPRVDVAAAVPEVHAAVPTRS